MKPKHWILSLMAVALLLVAGSPLAAATVANVEVGGDGVDWWPVVEGYDGLLLTITGPDIFCFSRVFEKGENPRFSLYDEKGNKIPDGVYSWELTVIPTISASMRKTMAEVRSYGDLKLEAELSLELPAAKRDGGYVAVVKGSFSDAGEAEKGSRAGQGQGAEIAKKGNEIAERATVLTTADGVIRNSLCVGFDCPNSPSYSDTTMLMMENNTRIKFDDTSSTASFPNNDWEIEANSNVNGGANYLGFNDCGQSSQGGCATDLVFAVEAGARQSALYVESDGDVGFGTSNPVVSLHVVDGNTPTLRLDQDGSAGFTPQVWDVAGNETNFFIRDATGGSQLPFRIFPGAASNTLVITGDERVGIRDSTPDDIFNVDVTGANGGVMIESLTDGILPQLTLIEPSGTWRFRVNNAGNFVFTDVTGGGNAPFQVNQGANNNLLSLATNTVTVTGNLTVTGVKNFVQPDPTDPARSFYYAALEGPEAGTYFRGSAKTVAGEAIIELPSVFSKITEADGLTVQLTPVGGWHQLYVVEKSPGRLVVRAAEGQDGIEFDFFVQGIRLGYQNYQVERASAQ